MSGFIHPGRLAACFTGQGAERTVAAMARDERFADRLGRCAVEWHGGPPLEPAFPVAADGAIAALEMETMEALAPACGAVIWSPILCREIRGEVVAALIGRFGKENMALARRNRDLGLDRPAPEGVDALEAAVLTDGRACLAAWIAAQSASAQFWLHLKWPSDGAVPTTKDAEMLTHGPVVLRRVAGSTAA